MHSQDKSDRMTRQSAHPLTDPTEQDMFEELAAADADLEKADAELARREAEWRWLTDRRGQLTTAHRLLGGGTP